MKFSSRTLLFLSIMICVLLFSFVTAISISSFSFVNDENISFTSEQPTINDVIRCKWTPSADVNSQEVRWYNGTTLYSGPTSVPLGSNYHDLSAGVVRKGETWWCNVSLRNATDPFQEYGISTVIKNAYPELTNLDSLTKILYEDRIYDFTVVGNDSDPGDEAILTYYVLENSFCSVDLNSGNLTCSPDQSDADAGKTNITIAVRDATKLVGEKVEFTVVEVNDPPDLSLSNQIAIQDQLFNYSITVLDEENHFPLSFTLETNLTSQRLNIYQTGDNTAYITFNRSGNHPEFAERGTWWVRVNVSDTGSGAATPFDDNFSTATFNLSIVNVNLYPNITTNLSDLNLAANQSEELYFIVNATDGDADDFLTFSISAVNCSLDDPWVGVMTTLNNSPTNGTGEVNVTLTNDHIVCREVNVTVTDGESLVGQSLVLNLTNMNDAPIVHQISNDPNNQVPIIAWPNQDIENLTGVKNLAFYYRVNATDIDNLTYEGENLTFTDNTSLFDINASTGIISFLPNESHVGNYSVLINVSDDGGLWDARVLNMTIINNTAPALFPIGNVSCVEDFLCQINISAFDPDNEDLEFESNTSGIFNLVDVNETTWQVNFTPVNDQVGNYTIKVRVFDQYFFSDEEDFIFSINNTNDQPNLSNSRTEINRSLNFGAVVENHTTTYTVYIHDEDLEHPSLDLDTMTYDFNFTLDPGNLASNFTFIAEERDYFTVQFTPTPAQLGTYQVNLSVNDTGGLMDWVEIAFTVVEQSSVPIVNLITPYPDVFNNNTPLTAYDTSANYPGNVAPLAFSENVTYTFDADITPDLGVPDNSLTYEWYVDGVLRQSNPESSSSFTYEFDFFSNETEEILLRAVDSRYSFVEWTWDLTIDDVNRNPIFINDLEDITLNQSTEYADYFSYIGGLQKFYDPDDDINGDGIRPTNIAEQDTGLTYFTMDPCPKANFEVEGDNLRVIPLEVGSCAVVFYAMDYTLFPVASNLVLITVTNVELEEKETPTDAGSSSSSPKPVPIPLEEPVDVPVPLEILTPTSLFTYANETVEIPIVIRSNWSESLNNIKLNASTNNASYNYTFRFSNDVIDSLSPNENVSVTLFVDNYRSGPAAIEVKATVSEPAYSDSATILISSMERRDGGSSVEQKISFARDLLNDNPECQELNELIEAAKKETNAQRAATLLDGAINGCKFLINEKIDAAEENPKSFFSITSLTSQYTPVVVVGSVILAVLLLFTAIMILTARKNKDLKGI